MSSRSVTEMPKLAVIREKDIVPPLARVSSGIDGLDELLHGGFPELSTVMVSGGSGTGKTIFCTQSLFYATAHGQRALYITFSEPIYKVISFASNLQFFDLRLVGEDKLRIIDLGPSAEKQSAEEIVNAIIEACKRFKPRRVGIDPVTMIGYLAKDELEIRQCTLKLGNALAQMGVNSILCSEAPITEKGYSRFGVEEYMADVILFLKHEAEPREKTLEIVKMRGSTHFEGRVDYTIDKRGMTIMRRFGGKRG